MMEIFEEKAMPYQLRSSSNLNLPKVRTTCYGTDTVRFTGQRIWAKLRIEVKTSVSLTVLKKILNQQNANIATVGFAKTFIYGLGFCNYYVFLLYTLFVNSWPKLAFMSAPGFCFRTTILSCVY